MNGFFVTFKKMPLAYLLAADQASALEGGQVGGHRGLRQAQALVELPGADTVFGAVKLVRKFGFRVFE